MVKFKLKKLKCPKCGYEWLPRREDPARCPGCQLYLRPRRYRTRTTWADKLREKLELVA